MLQRSNLPYDLQSKNTHHAQTSRQFRFVAHAGQIGLRSSSHNEGGGTIVAFADPILPLFHRVDLVWRVRVP